MPYKGLKELTFALLLYLAFSKYNLWFLALPALLILSTLKSLKSWFGAGFIFFFLSLLWVRIAMVDYGGVPLPIALFLIGLLSLFLAVYQFALTYLLWKGLGFRLIAFPFLWVFAEMLRSHFPYGGFPWLLMGELAVDMPLFREYLRVGGVYLGSAMLFTLAVLPFMVAKKSREVVVALLVLTLPLTFTFTKRGEKIPEDLKVVLVQTNVPEEIKLNKELFKGDLLRLLGLVEKALEEDPDIVILPESAFPFSADRLEAEGAELLRLSKEAYIITGLIDISDITRPKNGVFVLHEGKVVDRYFKVRLLPFGEYVPFPFSFVKDIFGAIAGVDYVGGEKVRCVKAGKVEVGTPICFEVSYFSLLREFSECSDLIAVLTNDGWFRDSDGTFQHLRQARVRALETGKYLLWVNNTGPSAVISPRGEILKSIPYGVEGVLEYKF